MWTKQEIFALSVIGGLFCACGGGGNDVTTPTVTYTIGGTVSGLVGTVVLEDNGGDDLSVNSNGKFTFTGAIGAGSTYAVTIATHPTDETCVVTDGSGTVANSNVTSVIIDCATAAGFSLANLSGSYKIVSYNPLDSAAFIWTVTFDGAGAFTGTLATINGQGAVFNGALSGTYTIATDGAATVSMTGSATLNGSVSADGGDGSRLVLSQVTPGQMPSIAIGIRQGQSAFTNANLKGTYKQVLLSRSVDHGAVLTISFDGAGHFSYTEIENDAGVITPNTKSGSYNVGADGAMTLFITDDLFSFTGGVSADANTLVLTRTTAGQPPNLTVAVKQARNTFTPADFHGPYKLVAYRSTGEVGVLSTITPDGSGNFSATETRDDAGTITNVTTTGTYRVDSSGALTLTVTGGSTGQGGLSTDAQSMALTETTSGVYPSLEFAIK